MNKRIQKKMAKRHDSEAGEHDPQTVTEALHRLEEDFVHLANMVLHQGRELSAQAVEGVVQSVERGEKSAEAMLDKIPGMGPQLAQLLHSLTKHGKNGASAQSANGEPGAEAQGSGRQHHPKDHPQPS